MSKSVPITWITQRLIRQLNNHSHNLQTINNGCHIIVTVNRYLQKVRPFGVTFEL